MEEIENIKKVEQIKKKGLKMVAHAGAKYLKLFNREAAPSTFIGASNFFKLAATMVLVLLE